MTNAALLYSLLLLSLSLLWYLIPLFSGPVYDDAPPFLLSGFSLRSLPLRFSAILYLLWILVYGKYGFTLIFVNNRKKLLDYGPRIIIFL